MKKLSMFLFTSLLAIMLAACSQTAEPAGKEVEAETKKETPAAKDKEKKESDITLQELFDKAVKSEGEIKSFASDLTLKQEMSQGDEKATMDSKITMEYIMDPIALSQKMEYTLDMGADGKQSMEMESYLTGDGFYMYEPTQASWLKMPAEFSSQIVDLENAQSNPAEAVNQLQEFADDFTLEESDTDYILKLSASGEKFTEFLVKNMKNTMPEDMLAGEEILSKVKFNNVVYEIYLDKKTLYPSVLNVQLEMETDIDGAKMNIKQEIKSNYRDYNTIDKIEVPQEVLDNAQEVTMEDLGA